MIKYPQLDFKDDDQGSTRKRQRRKAKSSLRKSLRKVMRVAVWMKATVQKAMRSAQKLKYSQGLKARAQLRYQNNRL